MSAASKLVGEKLDRNWNVVNSIERDHSLGTDGKYSSCYLVNDGNRDAFLKALDFNQALQLQPKFKGFFWLCLNCRWKSAVLSVWKYRKHYKNLRSSYEYERKVSRICKKRKLSYVTYAFTSGYYRVHSMGSKEGRVCYLIFEMACGDIRSFSLQKSMVSDFWRISVLLKSCYGLHELHNLGIAHQDIKPSNILRFSNSNFKITDLGRCSMIGKPVYYDKYIIPGDNNYAPPELLYGHVDSDFYIRRMGADLYMFGNLIVYVFTGESINTKFLRKLEPEFHFKFTQGQYFDLLSYLHEVFGEIIGELNDVFPFVIRKKLLTMVKQLCNPDYRLRGIPRDKGTNEQYSLSKYVKSLEIMVKQV